MDNNCRLISQNSTNATTSVVLTFAALKVGPGYVTSI